MSSIIRVRRGDMVVSFRRCSDGLLHVRRFERITLLPTQAARPTSSAQPFRPTMSEWSTVRKPAQRGFPHMLVGYMRVSTDSDRQVLDLQRDALVAAGVDERHLFEDRVSGSRGDGTGLAKGRVFS